MTSTPPTQYSPTIIVSHAAKIARITGAPLPGETLPNPNRTDLRDAIYGTDLGILWDAGEGQMMCAFGDTYGKEWGGYGAGPATAEWRCNTLALVMSGDPSAGLVFDRMVQSTAGFAKELIASPKDTKECTVIPTAGVTINERHFIHYMSVHHWGVPGVWETNYSGIAYSDDRGATWTRSPDVIWQNNSDWTDHFQQAAFVKDGGYVYLFGTPSGRHGDVYLARVTEADMMKKGSYQYWNGEMWVPGNEQAATIIVHGPVSELSVIYHKHFHRWLMMTLDWSRSEIVLRDAPSVIGPWSEPTTVIKSADYNGLYGGYMDPVHTKSSDLYFTISEWGLYNVFWMRAELSESSQFAGERNSSER